MTNAHPGTARGPDRFDEIEVLLKSYPDVTEDQLEELLKWFKKEASAFEVASLASKESTKAGYMQLRVDHLDRVSSRDLVFGFLFLAAVIVVLAAIWLLAP